MIPVQGTLLYVRIGLGLDNIQLADKVAWNTGGVPVNFYLAIVHGDNDIGIVEVNCAGDRISPDNVGCSVLNVCYCVPAITAAVNNGRMLGRPLPAMVWGAGSVTAVAAASWPSEADEIDDDGVAVWSSPW